MDIFTDKRFSHYLSNSTITKYFPKYNVRESSSKINPVYQLLKESQSLQQQHDKLTYLLAIQKQQNLRRTSMNLSQSKFIREKNIQRVKTMKNLIRQNSLQDISNDKINSNKKRERDNNICREVIKFNSFSYGIERFQKSLRKQKHQQSLLKKYINTVEHHFDKFMPDEDRTRQQIFEHGKIIDMFLNKHQQRLQQPVHLNIEEDDELGEQTKRKLQQKIKREKILKEMANSTHCQQKLQKGINNYLHQMQKSQSHQLLFKRKLNHSIKSSSNTLCLQSEKPLIRTSLINTSKLSSKISQRRLYINSQQPRCKTVEKENEKECQKLSRNSHQCKFWRRSRKSTEQQTITQKTHQTSFLKPPHREVKQFEKKIKDTKIRKLLLTKSKTNYIIKPSITVSLYNPVITQ